MADQSTTTKTLKTKCCNASLRYAQEVCNYYDALTFVAEDPAPPLEDSVGALQDLVEDYGPHKSEPTDGGSFYCNKCDQELDFEDVHYA